MNAAGKLKAAKKGIGGLAGTSFAAGRVVGATKASGRGARKGTKAAGLRAREIGRGAQAAVDRVPELRKELANARKELATARDEVSARSTRKLPVVAGVAAGAAGAYFFDLDNGNARRAVARDKALTLVRRGAAETRRKAQYAGGKAMGAVQEQRPSPRDPERNLNDPALARKVESEIFGGENAPKDKVVVNVENGVVYLRGEVESPGQAGALAQTARRVEGVSEVESLLHLPNEDPEAKGGQPKAAAKR